MSEWISVKKDIPGSFRSVLISIKDAQLAPLSGFRDGDEWWEHGGDRCNAKLKSEVTHWMPLPEPPA